VIGAFPTIRFQSGLDRPAASGVRAAAGFFMTILSCPFAWSVCLAGCLAVLSCRFVFRPALLHLRYRNCFDRRDLR
jgi:hypothetical protein